MKSFSIFFNGHKKFNKICFEYKFHCQFCNRINMFIMNQLPMIKEPKKNLLSQEELGISYEILTLIKEVNRALLDNRKIYQEILRLDPYFTHNLYQPIKHQGIDQMFLKPLLLRQIDHLMDEKQILIKKKEVLIFTKGEVNSKRDTEDGSTKHYAFLRSTWAKFQSKQVNVSEKIDNLNKIIGMVKANIKNLTQNEQRGVNKDLIFQGEKKSFNQHVTEEKTKEQYERLKMRNEELEMKFIGLGEVIESKNNRIEQLEHQLALFKSKMKQSQLALNWSNEKLQALKKSKQNLEAQVQRLQTSEGQHHFILFSGQTDDLKIKVKSNTFKQVIFQETFKNVFEVIDFLKEKTETKPFPTLNSINPQLQVPVLNLNGTSTSANENTFSDRYRSQLSKFIPMRTERSSLIKTKTLKQSSNLYKKQNNQQMSNFEVSQIIIKRFCRKSELTGTSERGRKFSESKPDKKEGQDIRNQLAQKFEMR